MTIVTRTTAFIANVLTTVSHAVLIVVGAHALTPDLNIYTEYLEIVPDFDSIPEGNKTGRWAVKSRHHGFLLGKIMWNGQWRQYTFFPEPDTVWSAGCLEDVARFITENKHFRLTKALNAEKPTVG